ncbi:MAG: ECF transporter S component [Chloroflexi bacterium]|nr:ECF transporter S component [Chloroflexota bacterium]
MKLLDSIKKDFSTTTTWVLIPVAIAINVIMGEIVVQLKLPVYLDSIGTVLVGVLCGPWAGALTGALSNTLWGLIVDPNALPWWPVALFIGFVAGWCAVGGLFKNWWKVIITGFLVAVTAAIVSTPIAVYIYGGITASGSSFITAYLLQIGQSLIPSVLITNSLVEPFDKISTSLLAFAIIQGLSKRFLARFPRAENVEVEEGVTRTQLLIAVGIVAVVLALYILVVIKMVKQ